MIVKFVVGADGAVTSAEVASTELNVPAVETCFVGRFLHMQFPVVSYPLLLSDG